MFQSYSPYSAGALDQGHILMHWARVRFGFIVVKYGRGGEGGGGEGIFESEGGS